MFTGNQTKAQNGQDETLKRKQLSNFKTIITYI